MMRTVISEGTTPMVCAPVVGKDEESIFSELKKILLKNPDIIEWRVDFFEDIGNTDDVVRIGNRLKEIAGATPIIFTIRAVREGGQQISLSEEDIVNLDIAICRETAIEYVDYELSNQLEHMKQLKKAAMLYHTKIIGSFHNFDRTPSKELLAQKFTEAEQSGADVAKIAVMPQCLEDVLVLLEATLAAKRRLTIPLITMSMGGDGAISRIIGGVFGSSLSFAVGAKSSAPGQIPIEDLRTALAIVERSMGDK